ncbi:DJ-1/PfpI family protein [Streptomyces rubellomurinus]|uniref:DJ-1/PfpI family protein n=1 Tax=Streptomyces sp. Y1 TaxID=3238634 RepID=A0AB39TTU8_9ACTN|nr:thiamine biosynthesis protein ThiJ [Streptomyces rubellomurinus subsp. indigoferus]
MTSSTGTTRRTVLRRATAAAGALGVGLAGVPTAASAGQRERIRVAVLLYDGFTALDAVGPYEALCRVPGVRVVTVGRKAGPVRTDTGQLALGAERAMTDVPHADVLLIPGGGNRGTIATMNDPSVLAWVRRIHQHSTWTTSVCTGALVLGSAGLLRGVPATTYWASRPYLAETFGAVVTPGRFVESGKIITAAGVSAGIDLGLHLAARLSDDEVGRAMQLAIEYDPEPPFDTGSPEKADEATRQLALKLVADAAAP